MLPLMIDVRLSLSSCSTFRAARIPIRTPAVAATDNGLLAPERAAGIQRVKSAKSLGVRAGNWLALTQAQALLNAPDVTTLKGLRDRAIVAVLLGCALRQPAVAALTMVHVQQRDGRWRSVDLYGKHGRVRTIPMPAWVKVAIDAWTARAGVTEGHVFRPVHRGDQLQGDRLSEKVVSLNISPLKCFGLTVLWSHRHRPKGRTNDAIGDRPSIGREVRSYQESLAELARRPV